MKFRILLAAFFAVALPCAANAQATILPPGETCWQATAGITGMVGLLGPITGGSGGAAGTFGGVSLTGGTGTGATANVTVSGGAVTSISILNPGVGYVVGDTLSAVSSTIGNVSGFSASVSSVSINSSLAGGSVGFFFPGTNIVKQTWQNATQTTLNQNPVPLDQNGCAVIFGVGSYQEVVQDSLGNVIYTQLTSSTSPVGVFWAGQASGTPNSISIADPSFANGDGTTIQFLAFKENTGPTTISVSGASPISIVKDTATGPIALSGGEIGPNNTPMISYDQINAEFHLVNPASTSSGSTTTGTLAPPQGYLNLVGQASGDVIQVGDVAGVATIFYSPFTGNQIPIWNGTNFVSVTFSELTTTLNSAGSPSSTIQDECVFSNNGVPTLVTGPSWTTITAGSGSRGTGAGSAQLTRLNGIWVNANSIIGYNGSSSYTIPADQCTYVGSILVDSSAGQVSAYRTIGQSRKWGIWNAYNRQRILMQISDPTSNWPDNVGSWHVTHGVATNSMFVLTGLPEEEIVVGYEQVINLNDSGVATLVVAIGIGVNSTSAPAGSVGQGDFVSSVGNPLWAGTVKAFYAMPPTIGSNLLNALSNVAGSTATPNLLGNNNMVMYAEYRG